MTTRDIFIAADHAAFDGHFEGAPILPGVALLSLVVETLTDEGAPLIVHNAKFLAPVCPATALQIRTTAPVDGRSKFEIHDAVQCVASGSMTIGAHS
ncbi:hypothetical protein BH10PSE17_BH10PSE17_38520 [soil metagenome]